MGGCPWFDWASGRTRLVQSQADGNPCCHDEQDRAEQGGAAPAPYRLSLRFAQDVELGQGPAPFFALLLLALHELLRMSKPRHVRKVECRTLGGTRGGTGITSTG